MRKYAEIARTYMKTQLAWRADVIFNMIFTAAKILFAYLLWGIIFSERNEVSGFTFHSMLSYYIVSSFLSQLEMSERISGEITARIRNGTFSNYMVLPVNIEWYFAAMEAGVTAFYFFFDLAAALVWICVFHIRFVLVKDIFLLVCALLIFYGIWKVIFYCFLPYGIMATLPVQSMIGEMNWKLGAFGIAVVCVFCLATCLVWKTGIRHYNSASS